jgi:IclR family pca regulon transcriptional regulator
MGRVQLAARPDEWLASYLAAAKLEPLTPHTITDPARLHDELMVIRKQGWALVDQELEVGLRSVAVPLHDASRRVVAAVNVSAHASRSGHEMIRGDLLPRLQATVALIEEDLAGGAAPRA